MLSTVLLICASLMSQAPNDATQARLKEIERPYIGLAINEYEPMVKILEDQGIKPPKHKCVFATQIDPLGPCMSVRYLDVVSHVNDTPIESGPQYVELIRAAMATGEPVNLTVRPVHEGKSNGQVTWRSSKKLRVTPTTRKEIALRSVATETDKVENRSWVRHKGVFDSVFAQNLMLAKFNLSPSKVPYLLRLEVGYTAPDWLFIQELKLSQAGDSITLNMASNVREVLSSRRITEVVGVSLGSKEIAFFDDHCNVATLRQKGDSLYVDRKIETDELWAVKRVVDAYVAMGGEIDGPLPKDVLNAE